MSSIAASTSGSPSRIRPYASPNHNVTKGRYITSNDPRGYIPVYEYPLNGQWIMMDVDDGYVLWTGIWKALGNSKADIVKLVDSQPDLAPLVRRVRGGYLKIQGTWLPFETALKLARRVSWSIREDLVPLFGPTFPDSCLSPDQAGYGQLFASRRGRRSAAKRPSVSSAQPASPTHAAATDNSSRYSPYPSTTMERPRQVDGSRISLAPVRTIESTPRSHPPSSYALPPISALEDMRGMGPSDSRAVLRRLIDDDNEERRQRRICPSDNGHVRSERRVYDRQYHDRYSPSESSRPSSETSSEGSVSPRLGSPTLPNRHSTSYTKLATYQHYPQQHYTSRDNTLPRHASYVDSNGHHRLAPTL